MQRRIPSILWANVAECAAVSGLSTWYDLQELFPESYAETAAWLRREVNANGDSLARCEEELQQAVEQDPEFQALAAGCQVSNHCTDFIVGSSVVAYCSVQMTCLHDIIVPATSLLGKNEGGRERERGGQVDCVNERLST